MATNFEYYKDKILEISKGAFSIASKNGKVYSCQEVRCNECDFHKHNPCVSCNAPRYEWLYAEHIEQPKLTKRERAFCEAVQTGWIAGMHAYRVWGAEKPYHCESVSGKYLLFDTDKEVFEIPDSFNMFRWMKNGDLYEVEDLLKLEVMEEVQHETD